MMWTIFGEWSLIRSFTAAQKCSKTLQYVIAKKTHRLHKILKTDTLNVSFSFFLFYGADIFMANARLMLCYLST